MVYFALNFVFMKPYALFVFFFLNFIYNNTFTLFLIGEFEQFYKLIFRFLIFFSVVSIGIANCCINYKHLKSLFYIKVSVQSLLL